MMGEPYSKKPHPGGLPTPYQDTPAKLFEDNSADEYGGDKFPLRGGMPSGMLGASPPMPPVPQPYGGMADLDGMLQQRKANDERRQLLAQMLAGQQQPQGPAPYANSAAPVNLPPPIAEASPWSIVAAAFNGLADGYKRAKSRDNVTDEGANAWWGSDGGLKS